MKDEQIHQYGNVSSPLSMEALGCTVGLHEEVSLRRQSSIVWCEGGLDARFYLMKKQLIQAHFSKWVSINCFFCENLIFVYQSIM